MNVHRLASSATVQAPAKLNLFFEVLARRNDGYHEIESLMVPISLCDTLVATLNSSGAISLNCQWADPADASTALGVLPPAAENLATRAAQLLRTRAGIEQGLAMTLIKRIPSAAGLGGGSSDAAAALLAANELWNTGWSRTALAELGAELGSDIPFFLGSGAAVCRGRGELIEPVAGLIPLHFVVVRPPEGLSTALVYRACQVASEPRRVEPLVESLRSGDARGLKNHIHNRLRPAAEGLSPWVARVGRELSEQDCLATEMSGSGTGYFGICRHARHAARVARRLRARGLGRVYAASTSS